MPFFPETAKFGTVARIVSRRAPEKVGHIDLLVNFDDEGRVLNLKSLKEWQVGTGDQDPSPEGSIDPFLEFLVGKNMDQYKQALTIITEAVDMAGKKIDEKEAPAPPPGRKIEIKQKFLEVGSQIPGN